MTAAYQCPGLDYVYDEAKVTPGKVFQPVRSGTRS